MPTLKAIHICNSLNANSTSRKLQNSMPLPTLSAERKSKHIPPTKCINHWAISG